MFLKMRELYYRVKFYFKSTKRKNRIILPNDCNIIRIEKEFYRY
jgi:hypothetical protein